MGRKLRLLGDFWGAIAFLGAIYGAHIAFIGRFLGRNCVFRGDLWGAYCVYWAIFGAQIAFLPDLFGSGGGGAPLPGNVSRR
jgi:hypothetical protein